MDFKHSNGKQFHLEIAKNKNDNICAVTALTNYLTLRNNTTGPLFLNSSGEAVSRQLFQHALNDALNFCGLSRAYYKPHSFRIGFATDASAKGLSTETIRTLDGGNISATGHVQTTTIHVRTTAEDVHTTVEHVLTTAEHVLTTAEHVHTTAQNLRTTTESVRTTEGLSSIITIFQTIQDDKKSVLTIVLVIVLLVFSIVVIGLMYSKVKSNNTRPTIDVNRFRRERYQHEDQRIERHDAQVWISRTHHEDPKIEKQVWMERDRIRGDLQIYFLDF
ncbi:Hypothetical predicted protein [Mytilus galloprovincialis]|uniref:Tyr recombinase domain-containing protein n=1 Tax=Mytilus galloprovincialis TaxID=29158 RepID=A0A8B6BNU2_MYTGA|nr:Hypothetical predicted protein [Mytilus galloprovincialis]